MRERPILFSAPMVRALLEGRKSQTRRVVKHESASRGYDVTQQTDGKWAFLVAGDMGYDDGITCPYGKPGDRLWVRETWWQIPEPSSQQLRDGADTWPPLAYNADESEIGQEQNRAMGWKLRPSIFMPRWASRITLEITEVRVQRLQEISGADAIAEGIEKENTDAGVFQYWRNYSTQDKSECLQSPRMSFGSLWESINGNGSWDANPWVWAVSFKVVAGEVEELTR